MGVAGSYNCAEMDAWQKFARWLLGPEPGDPGHLGHLLPRWIWLRALGLIYFSAFYSLLFQIKGLIGPQGIFPAEEFLKAVPQYFPGVARFWFAPTLLWFSSGDAMLMTLCWVGIAGAIAAVLNLWPRAALLACFLCFLSFVAAAQDFSAYQSDGMLLEAGFISLFFAPPGIRPGLGAAHPPSRFSLFLLRWEWFRIYFESGVVKLASGDYSWRHLTAMDDYYQNGPLPTWIGWYIQQLPHRFHAATVVFTFIAELGLVFMMFLPRRWKIICFFIVTPFQIGIILSANYAFLNYIVLALGFLLLDDRFFRRILLERWKRWLPEKPPAQEGLAAGESAPPTETVEIPARGAVRVLRPVKRVLAAWGLGTVFYITLAELLGLFPGVNFLPAAPVKWLSPLRIANQYGLFAVMTHERYEIEFQGSNDGVNWIAYPFRYKPQDVRKAPGIYSPYHPRFDWNLWFASLSSWRENMFVVDTEARLLSNDQEVLKLFAGNPFAAAPPVRVRTVLWQYWFTDLTEKRRKGAWWKRQLLGAYAPALKKTSDGKIVVADPGIGPATQSEH